MQPLKKKKSLKRLRDFSPKNHINLERLIGKSAHHLNLERLKVISAHLILDGQTCLCSNIPLHDAVSKFVGSLRGRTAPYFWENPPQTITCVTSDAKHSTATAIA